MEFLRDIFLLYWKEVIVAVMLMMTLPFIRVYVRRRRAMVINFFREKERLKQSLQEAQGEAERLCAALEESERKYYSESEAAHNAQNEADNLRALLEQERKAREQAEGLVREVEKQKQAQWVEKNSIEAEFSRKYATIQNEIKEKGGFIKFAEEIFEDSKALRYDETTYVYCASWASGLLIPTHLLFDFWNDDCYSIDCMMRSVHYLLASQHSKDEISQFSENALISFYNFSKEALLAVGIHLVNCGKMTLDELRKGYCGNILDFREMIRNRTQDSRATYSMNREAYHRTTEILRKAMEAQKGNNNS